MKKIAINGFGRIGRLIFKELIELDTVEIVAINDLSSKENMIHLLKYDSTYGKNLSNSMKISKNKIKYGNHMIEVISERDPVKLPWKRLNIDLVIEATGLFTSKEKAQLHLKSGAKKVIITAPASGNVKTIVYNVNHNQLSLKDTIISAASCTTNALALIVKPLNDNFKIMSGFMTTVHAVTNDQRVLDAPHKDLRRSRSILNNIIPTSTGAAATIGKVIPELNNKMDGVALRVPVNVGSIVDLTLELGKNATIKGINDTIKRSVNQSLDYVDDEIVSSDIIGSTHGSIFDAKLTKKIEGRNIYKVFSWYDNESSYVNQLLRLIKYMISL